MNKILCSVFDCKAESWSLPCVIDNKAVALRQFADLVSDKRTLVGQHPADFNFFVVGTFNSETGAVVGIVPELIANGLDCVVKE